MAAYAFSNKTDAQKFAAKQNKTVTSKYKWIVKPLSGNGYVVFRVGANVTPSKVKNIRTS